jgi:hypothetical protein
MPIAPDGTQLKPVFDQYASLITSAAPGGFTLAALWRSWQAICAQGLVWCESRVEGVPASVQRLAAWDSLVLSVSR